MSLSTPKSRVFLKYCIQLFRLEAHQSPLFFHGLRHLLWRLTDVIPGRLGVAARWFVGKGLLKRLGAYPHFRSKNIFFDGRNTEIGDNFSSGYHNYFAGGPIRIGNNVRMANYIILETTSHVIDDVDRPIREQGIYRQEIVIEDDVWIGDRATIIGCRVGQGSVVAAGAVVTRDVPPFSIVGGVPAKILKSRRSTSD